MRIIKRKLITSAVICLSISLLVTPLPIVKADSITGNGSICIDAYWDNNGNGSKEADDPYFSGVPITLITGDTILIEGETNAVTMKCFTVEPGQYRVIMGETASPVIIWTTRHDWDMEIISTETIHLEFGVSQMMAWSPEAVDPNTDPQPQPIWSIILSVSFIVFSVLATPVAVISLVINLRILKVIRQLYANNIKESQSLSEPEAGSSSGQTKT